MTHPNLLPILKILEQSQSYFREMLEKTKEDGGLTQERYCRFLTMQYHLTKGVQKPFLTVASHADFGHRRELRSFLVNFANEEEFHYEIARKDLENLGQNPGEIPFDVELWWAYFNEIVKERPFVRLGATIILENLSNGSKEVLQELMSQATYLNKNNTVFFRIHQHEALPHGDQIIEALSNPRNSLEDRHFADLKEGAIKASILYSRMAKWALYGNAAYGDLLKP